ncbi:MAG: MerR family transcriptional regulator [Chitinophagaceae bacterium]|nr:MerR family transcriptional regulator [Chitinophagaceae bacterium]
MDLFSISDIENLSGIKAHTIRIWEQRYSLLLPKRRESKHRYYDNEDLRQILQIAHLNRNGYKISKIARMNSEQIKTLALEKGVADCLFETFVEQLLQACKDLDEERFNKTYLPVSQQIPFEKVVLNIFYPLLERIGIYWMTETTRPVQEHFASHLIIKKIVTSIHELDSPVAGETTVLFNPEGEHHEIPTLFIQYLLKKNGKRCHYLGANLSMDVLTDYIRHQQVHYLHLHVITNFSSLTMDEMARKMLDSFTQQTIIMSGPLTKDITIYHERLILLRSLDDLLSFCNKPALA